MPSIEVTLSCKPLGRATVIEARGREAMDELASWTVLVAADAEVDLASLLRAPVTIRIRDELEGAERAVTLIVVDAWCEKRRNAIVYSLTLSDPEWLLTKRRGHRLFIEKTTEQIVTTMLEDGGTPSKAIVPRLSGEYPVRYQCVQYAETDWAFITRLLADEGISFWFDTTSEGEHRIILGDSSGSHDGIDGDTQIPFVSAVHGRSIRPFHTLEWEERVVTTAVHVRDLDIRHPDVYIEGKAGDGKFHHFEYPANVPTSDAADKRAKRRLEQLQRDKVSVIGTSHCVRLAPGRVLSIAGGGADLFDQRVLVAEVEHSFARSEEGVAYSNRVVMKPSKGSDGADHPPFRPALMHPSETPSVEHLESAITTGPSGEEIHVDDLGRVKLRFLWDRSGVKDDKSSNWVRALQVPLGASMLLPRVGWEVVVGYLDGLPDRPFVLGRVYNATAVTPYALPAASATTSFQSHTTPKSGATQEIKMSDDAGKQEFFVHATKDLSIKVGGSHTTDIDGLEEHSVGLSLTTNVAGSHTVAIGGIQSIDVGQEIMVAVKGTNTEIIAAAEINNVTGNRVMLANSCYVEVIGAAYGIQCNQSNTQTTGAFTRIVGGNKTLMAGIGVSESVAGIRTYICRGSRTVTTGKDYSESVIIFKRSKAGAVSEKASSDLGVQATIGKLTCGAATIKAGGKVSIMAKKVTIDVSSAILAENLELSGGAFRTKGGMFEVSGDTTRARGGEVGG